MQYQTLGHSDIAIAPIIFGGNVFGWTLDEHASFQMIDTCIIFMIARTSSETCAPVCYQHGVCVIPYFALASGFLTGKYRSRQDASGAAREHMVDKYFDDRGTRILAALWVRKHEMKASNGVMPVQVNG